MDAPLGVGNVNGFACLFDRRCQQLPFCFSQFSLIHFILQRLNRLRQFLGSFGNTLFQRSICVLKPGRQFINAKMHPYPRQNLFPSKRLGNIIHRPSAKPLNLMLGFRQSRHKNNRNILCLLQRLQPAARLESVDSGHHDIKQNKIRLGVSGPGNPAFPILGNEYGIRAFVEITRNNTDVIGIVINDQNSRSLHVHVHFSPS